MAPQADIVIRGGLVVDGSGAPPFVADVAVTGGKISAVGPSLPCNGKREYDARGLMVAPGWVDAHTHFDGQVTWDPYLTPSSSGGVTTCIMGNCGVGFAPCQRERRDELITLVEAIEDIPGTAIHEGIKWEWETFEEYLDLLGSKQYACDVAAMIGHSAVRSWVLGERMNHSDRPGGGLNAPVRKHEVEAMAAVVRDAVAAGAIGFSTSRAIYHRDMTGVLMPGSLASSDEMLSLLRAIGEGGGGVFEANLDFAAYDDVSYDKMDGSRVKDHWASEWRWLNTIAAESPGKINMTFEATSDSPERMKKVEEMMEAHGKNGLLVRTQIHARPQGFLQAVNSRMSLLLLSKTFRRLDKLDLAALLHKLRDPSLRRTIIDEAQATIDKSKESVNAGKPDGAWGLISTLTPFHMVYPWTMGCEPSPEESVKAIAKRAGVRNLEAYYDILVPPTGSDVGVAWKPLNNHQDMYWNFSHPLSIPGVSDAGAHAGVFNDANGPTHLLTHWARDRTRGPKFPVEFLVRKQTSEVANLFGLSDRGLIRAGMRADLNVIDFDKLEQFKPFVSYDLPTGASRWMQRVSGYRLTLVAGLPTYEDGRATGSLPGRLVRNPKSNAGAWRGEAQKVVWRPGGASSDASTLDMKEYALKAAIGGGASAIGRIARDMEANENNGAVPRSRL